MARLTVTAPVGAVVVPTVMAPVVDPVNAREMSMPPLMVVIPVPILLNSATTTVSVPMVSRLPPPTPCTVSPSSPVQAVVSSWMGFAVEVMSACSTLLRIGSAASETPAVSVTISRSVPSPPSMRSAPPKPPATVEVMVSS